MRIGLGQCAANGWPVRARAWLRTATNSSIEPRFGKAAKIGRAVGGKRRYKRITLRQIYLTLGS